MEAEARLVPLYEVLGGTGHGWAENWFRGDPDCAEEIDLAPAAWCCGYTVYDDGSVGDRDVVAARYGRQYGVRYWDGGRPTAGQREAVPWTTEEGKDIVGRVQ